MPRLPVPAAALAAVTLAPALAAQTTTPPAPTDTARAVVSPDSAKSWLRAGRWSYKSTLTSGGHTRDFGKRRISVTPSSYAGADAWLLVDAQDNGPTKATDSLLVDRTTLDARYRVARLQGPMGEVTLAANFEPDSVLGQVVVGGERQPIAMKNVPGAVTGDAMIVSLLPALPLATGWTASVLVINPQARSTTPLQLTVVGEEQVRVPAGRFSTWVVEAEAGQAQATYYVAKGGGPVVRVAATVAQLGAGLVETVLERIEKPR